MACVSGHVVRQMTPSSESRRHCIAGSGTGREGALRFGTPIRREGTLSMGRNGMAELGGIEEQETRKTVGRRGVIAGAAALAAALIAKQTADPVSAANGGPVLIG